MFTVPTTIAQEMEYNVFMRSNEERLLKLTGTDSEVACMAFLRELKNTGKQPKL